MSNATDPKKARQNRQVLGSCDPRAASQWVSGSCGEWSQRPAQPRKPKRRRSNSGLHERLRNDLLNVCSHDADEVVCLGCPLLLLHFFRLHKVERRHQTDHEQFHALNLGHFHVILTKSGANGSTGNHVALSKANNCTQKNPRLKPRALLYYQAVTYTFSHL